MKLMLIFICFYRCEEARAFGKSIDISIDDGKWYEKKAQEQKDTAAVKPTVLPITGWIAFKPESLPQLFNFGHVYHWLVESIPNVAADSDTSHCNDDPCDSSYTTLKQLTRGRQYVTSGFIHDILSQSSNDLVHFKTKVDASMKKDLYNVTVSMSKISGAIKDASCHCKASSLCRCSHIAALLLKLTDHVGQSPACTSVPCGWNKGTKRKNPSSINTADYNASPSTKPPVIKFDPRPETERGIVSDVSVNNFLSNMSSSTTSMWETIFTYKYDDYELTDERKNVLCQWQSILLANLTPDINNISLNNTYATMLANTEDQSTCSVWNSHRYLRITASHAKETVLLWSVVEKELTSGVMHRCRNYLKKYVWGLDNVQTYYMRRGIELEEKARENYLNINPTCNVKKTGIWVSRQFPQLACSPDGLVCTPNNEYGLLEIKCLKLLEKMSVSELIEKYKCDKSIIKGCCFKIVQDQLVLVKSHSYYYQIQFQLGITGFPWCDFVLYSGKGDPSIERIYPDESAITDIFTGCLKLWKSLIAPEILEMRVPRNLKPFII